MHRRNKPAPAQPATRAGPPRRALGHPRASVHNTAAGPVIDLDRYVPGLLTMVNSALTRGASAAYLSVYAVGIETWRILVMLAIEPQVTAQRMVQLLDADKGAISRTFKTMCAEGLLTLAPDAHDRRLRHAVITAKGRALHDRIVRLALLREDAALSVLSDAEVQTLRDVLRRINGNLAHVEAASAAFIRTERQAMGLPADAPALRRRGGARLAAAQPATQQTATVGPRKTV